MGDFEMKGGERELSEKEAERFAGLLGVIETYRLAGLDAGRALREIRELRLWRSSETSWARWCERELPLTKRMADRLIAFAGLVDDMGPRGPAPVNEKQARLLVPLSEVERDKVATAANLESGGKGFEGVAAASVGRAADAVTGRTGGEVVPLHGRKLVQVSTPRGVGSVSLPASGFLGLLDHFEKVAVAIAALGPQAVETAMLAIPEKDAVRRGEQVERTCRVAVRLMKAAEARWPEGYSEGQERFALK